MFRYDRVLIDPTADALSRALAEAAVAANKGFRARLLKWPAADYAAFVANQWAVSEGQHQWQGAGPAGDTRSVAAVVWWSDPAARRHCRICSARVTCGDVEEDDLFQPDSDGYRKGRERPGLWRVYPDDLYLRGAGGKKLWAGCRCGVSGTPAKLGWMGPWCAACHDRAEEGQPQSWPGAAQTVFSGHPFWVGDVAFHPEGGALLVLVEYQPDVWIWDLQTGTCAKRTFPGRPKNSKTAGLTVSAGTRRAAVCVEGQVYIWSLVDETAAVRLATRLGGYASPVAMALNPAGTILATACSVNPHGQVALHDAASGALLRTLAIEQSLFHLGPRRLAFSPDGKVLAIGSNEPIVRRFDVASGRELSAFTAGAEFGQTDVVAFSPDGTTLGAGDHQPADGCLQLWDAATGIDRGQFPGPVTCLAFSPDSRLLATVGEDALLRLRNVGDGRLLATFRWHQNDIDTVAFSPDGRWLATGGKEDRVKLWPVAALLAAH